MLCQREVLSVPQPIALNYDAQITLVQAQQQAQKQLVASTDGEATFKKKDATPSTTVTAILRPSARAGTTLDSSAPRSMTPIEGLKKAHDDAIVWMYKPHGVTVDGILQFLERHFSMQREYVAYILAGIWLVYMMIGGGAQFLSNLIGFIYPCYASVLAIRSEGQDDDTHWLIYWTTFASFFLVDTFASIFLQWFPLYFILKSAFLVYLWLPQTMGAQYLYKKYVDPTFTYIEKNWLSQYT